MSRPEFRRTFLTLSSWLRTSFASPSAASLLFLLSLLLSQSVFLPNLNEINPFDEAAYVYGGYSLLAHGGLPRFADNPLIGLFYAIMAAPFRGSPFLLVHANSLGRIVLFSLLWLATYRVARELKEFTDPLLMLGMLFVMPLTIDMLRFPSDPLFASLAGLSLSQLLGFRERRDRRQLWLASLFLGLSAFARNDGLVLFPIMALAALILVLPSKEWWKSLVATILPFSLLVGGYVAVFGLRSGDFSLRTMDRAYDNFEAGHNLPVSGEFSGMDPVAEAKLETRRLFGTPEENRTSILRAIRKNPTAYIQRLRIAILSLPRQFLHAYGIRFSALLLFLALRGVLELVQRRQFRLLGVLLIWPTHLVTGFAITLFREGHLRFPFYVVLALASIGLAATLHRLNHRIEQALFTVSLAGLGVYGVVDDKLAVTYGALVVLAGLWLVRYLKRRHTPDGSDRAAPLLLLLAVGIVVRGNFPAPKIRSLGELPDERAVLYMAENLEPGTVVAAGSGAPVWSAGMSFLFLGGTDVPVHRESDDFFRWLVDQGAEAVYVDHTLSSNTGVWENLSPQIGKGLERVFVAEEGDFQVLLVTPDR